MVALTTLTLWSLGQNLIVETPTPTVTIQGTTVFGTPAPSPSP
jgi:hypothetical protein